MLIQRIEDDYKEVFRARDEFAVSVLRVLRTALKNAEIAKRPAEFNDDDALKVIKTEVKKLTDALSDFSKANRADLIGKTQKEIDFLKKYLPAEMSDTQVEEIARRVIDVMKPSGPQDFGRVMGAVMKETRGQASGDSVSKIVKRLLS